MASGHVSRAVEGWQDCLLGLMAGAEAELNFADEDDVEVGDAVARRLIAGMGELAGELGEWLARPAAEVIAGGLSGVIAGPDRKKHTSELQSLMRISYAVFSLKKQRTIETEHTKRVYYRIHITCK